ncbi:MAG: ABC transporter ATP-binding protein [Ferrovum sp.]|nr:ABC transporter ATP-binding protein [Ferrovum sp.]NDU87644.1 ABC transporter ATP-binding protein [Ferrovum sp.]
MPTPPDLEWALRLEEVSRSFRIGERVVKAVDQVTASATSGAITGLIGPDGAGKTTLMRLIAGLLRPDSGHITLFDIDVGKNPMAAQARLGYMPQRFGLYDELSVQENLDLYADLQGVPIALRAERYAELLHMTGLGPFTARMAGHLSGGMKQKLGLACTLVHPPELLLLDEPTVGVDPVSRRELWHIIEDLTHSTQMTVLFSTSYLDEAERCDSVWLIHEGQLLGSGPPASFTAEMTGRSFLASSALSRRRLQGRLAQTPGMIDALIQGDGVRVTTTVAVPPNASIVAPDIPDLSFLPVPPRFEDSFVARLRTRVSEPQSASPALSPTEKPIPSSKTADIISVEHLTRRFGEFVAVNDVSFRIAKGEIFGLLGANGAGKSTTFRMLCGLLPASSGSLQVAGFDLRTAAAQARERIGYMAQKFSLYGDLSVYQNLRFFSSAYRLSGKTQKTRIDWAVEEFGLASMLKDTARDLPLGYKQRLALACALMHEPDILFLDEPTSGVDPLARRDFWHRINQLAESGVTILVTTHFMEEAEYCDRLIIMAQGNVLSTGEPEAIKAAARTPENPDPRMEDAFISIVEATSTRIPAQ